MKFKVGIALAIGYVACVFGANWAGEKYGIVAIGFGLTGPAGLYFVGLSFGLRDFTQETLGRWWVWAAILIGAALSYLVAPSFALASGVAFLASEAFDWTVYTPLRHREWGVAVFLSNLAGSITDSVLFLWIAFGWSAVGEFWFGQTVGKMYLALPFVAAIWMWRNRDLFERLRSARTSGIA